MIQRNINMGCTALHSSAPVFVVGVPRSGTTVISEAIAAHEEFGWLSSYMSRMPDYPELAMLSRILDLPFIGERLRGKKKQNQNIISSFRSFMPFPAEAYSVWNRYCRDDFGNDYLKNIEATVEEKKRVRSLVSKVLRYHGKKRFFAKFTGPSRIKYLQSIFPDAYFIHVIRDPRANISSLLRVDFWREKQGYTKPWWSNGLTSATLIEWESYDQSPVALAALQWREILETAWQESELLRDDRYIEIHYEDYVKNPIRVINGVYCRIQLAESRNTFRYITSIGKVRDMNYKFREHLNQEDVKLIEKITSATAQKAGYFKYTP